jgi:NADP-dependent 3-hydroxy acid dehydrogenase YdfG
MLLGQLETQDVNEWKSMFDVNVISLLNGMQSVLAPMKARNTGTIINISSVAGRKTFGKVETDLISHTTCDEIKQGYQAWK